MARRRLLKSYFYLKYDGIAYGEAVTVSPFNATGGTDTFEVTSYRPWTVISKPSWLTLSTESGDKGTTIVTITAGANPDVDIKTGDIVIKTNTYKYTGTVSCSIKGSSAFVLVNGVSILPQTIDSDTTTVQYTVTSKGGWTFSSEGSVPCTSDVQSVSDTGDTTTTVTITYGENTSVTADKTFIARFTSNQTGGGTAEVDVTQKPKSNVVLERTTNVTIPYDGMVGAINVTANTPSVNLTLPALITVSENPVTKPAGTPGYEYTKQITFTAATLDPTQTATTGYTYILTGTTDDGKASDTVSFHYEPYPYLNINQSVTVDSATTTGVSPFSSNYPVSVTSLTPGLEVAIVGNQVEWVITEPSSWTDQVYEFKVSTIDIEGTPIEKTVTVTKDADVAYLTINPTAQTVAYPGRSFAITGLSTNDDYTVTIPAEYSSWLTYDPVTGLFTVQENPEGAERVANGITFTTVHNGSAGTPVSVEVKITQTGRNVEAILVVLDMKQNSAGTWYIMTTNADNVNIPITLSNNGNDFATTSDGRAYSASPFTTAVGTNIGTVTGTEQYVSGGQIYNITYQVNSSVPYSETVSERVPTSISLAYDDYAFLANGSASTTAQNSHISDFTVNYEEHITNSFDDTVRTVSKTLQGPEHLSAISGTASNGGSLVAGSFDIAAANRGMVTGNSWTVYTITGFSYVLEGATLSASTSLTFTQEENLAGSPVYDASSSSSARTAGATTQHYIDIGFTVERDDGGDGFDAAGVVKYKTYDYITVNVTETGKTYSTTAYDYTGTSAYTVTYTSGEISAYTVTDTWSTTESGATTNYSNRATYEGWDGDAITSVTPNRQDSGKQDVYSENRGTEEGPDRYGYLHYRSTHDTSKTLTVTIPQDENYGREEERIEYTDKGTEYSGVTITINASEDEFKADGHTPEGSEYIYITATESYSYAGVSGTTVYTDIVYDSGAIEEDTTGTPGDDVYGTWARASEENHNITTGRSVGDSLYYEDSSQRVIADFLGTTETSAQSLELIATATHDSSVSDSVTITQEANVRSVGDCELSATPMIVEFTDTFRSDTVQVTAFTTYSYTSGASGKTGSDFSTTISGYNATAYTTGNPTLVRPGIYNLPVSCPSYTGYGKTLPATLIITADDCPTTTVEVDVYYDGGSQPATYPTVTAGTYKAETYWGVYLDFDTNLATTGVQWSCGGSYQVTVTEPWSNPETYQGSFQITGHCDEFGEVVIDNTTGQYISFDKEETTQVWLRDTRTMSPNAELSEDYASCSQPGGL